MKKITDINVLNTIKLKELINAIKDKLTPSEIAGLNSEENKDIGKKRQYVILLYNKYIDEVVGAEKAETVPYSGVKEELPPPQEDKTTLEERLEEAKQAEAEKASEGVIPNEVLNSSALKSDALKSANLTNCYAVDIRRVPGFNGIVTMIADKLIALILKNPNGQFKFKSTMRAQVMIDTINSVKTIKGIYNITDEKKAQAIKTIKRSNNMK